MILKTAGHESRCLVAGRSGFHAGTTNKLTEMPSGSKIRSRKNLSRQPQDARSIRTPRIAHPSHVKKIEQQANVLLSAVETLVSCVPRPYDRRVHHQRQL